MRVSTDDRCRMQSRELLKPNARYEGELDSQGRVILTRLVKAEARPRLVKPVLRKGLLVLPDLDLDEAALDEQVREERDELNAHLLG